MALFVLAIIIKTLIVIIIIEYEPHAAKEDHWKLQFILTNSQTFQE